MTGITVSFKSQSGVVLHFDAGMHISVTDMRTPAAPAAPPPPAPPPAAAAAGSPHPPLRRRRLFAIIAAVAAAAAAARGMKLSDRRGVRLQCTPYCQMLEGE